MIKERVEKLRALMAQKNIDAYVIPTDDFHGSEDVGEYFRCRAFISGFTGSAGTVIVTKDKAGLWTDGRYFLLWYSISSFPFQFFLPGLPQQF